MGAAPIQRTLAQVILDVADMERSLAFYRGLLGLSVAGEDSWNGHRLVHLATGQTELLLLQQPEHEQNRELERSGGVVINFQVDNIRRVMHGVRQGAAKVLEHRAGYGTFLVADPDGYTVLLSERARPALA